MRAGKLNNRIRLLRPIVVRDDRTGGSVKSYEFVAEVWADAEPISNRKIRTGEQRQVVETMLFTLRPRDEITVDWQVVFQQRTFTVRAPDRSQRDRLLITAEADIRHDRV
ncbi:MULTISPECIES: phage head closure protein [Serratia]|uniref:phage head closure protein n=1 Tax=Serratia TaxID=613 RepID=UPI001A19D9EF|nr:phage head closure protein [Serratia marcescens]MDP8624918.1 phage head closure protein [Serratia marcescens]MDP8674349.1 phage head closure protein [Serratia marcescens]MDP8689351.1 phage head closure protein [Serratia marcescens]MDP8699098.1 phage head closure protein [Serratia marcescens]MDP8708776.1 phage head closure protein [Serratia marcescens]